MSDIAPIPGGVSRIPDQPSRGGIGQDCRPIPGRADAVKRPSDRVELSDRARFLSRLAEGPSVRTDLVQRVRGEIEAGTYETPERLEAAAEALREDLDLS